MKKLILITIWLSVCIYSFNQEIGLGVNHTFGRTDGYGVTVKVDKYYASFDKGRYILPTEQHTNINQFGLYRQVYQYNSCKTLIGLTYNDFYNTNLSKKPHKISGIFAFNYEPKTVGIALFFDPFNWEGKLSIIINFNKHK